MSTPSVKPAVRTGVRRRDPRRTYLWFLLEFKYLDLDAIHEAALEMGLPPFFELAPLQAPSRRDPVAGEGCVYVVRAATGLYKIGSTKHLTARVLTLQTGSPVPLEVVHVIHTKQHLHKALERRLHTLFKAKRVQGEWFKLTHEDVATLKQVS